jgi:DNA-binding NarL/FixJ family response regulator
VGSEVGPVILVVEDDVHTRDYFVETLAGDVTVRRVHGASCLADGIAMLEEDPPDVLLVDLGLPDGNGIELILHAREHSPTTRAMVISVFGDEVSIIRALKAGARGYLLKSEGPDDLRRSVAHLLEGGAPISPAIASHLLRQFSEPAPAVEAGAAIDVGLTDRESQVLQLIVKGLSYQDVADALEISRHTATSHIRNIYRKLEVRSRSEAVFEALSLGIVKVDERD